MRARSVSRLALLLVAVPLALAWAGCGSDEPAATSTVTETTTETTSTTETTGSTEDGGTPQADVQVTELTAFTSPSGNIGCQIDREAVRCDIAERDWEPPPPPADCQLDYGQGIMLTAGGEAALVCAGDTALAPGAQELPYGQSIAAGLLRCESSESGMSCRDVETGRGFRISRQGYELN
jgi:hypothetical protein